MLVIVAQSIKTIMTMMMKMKIIMVVVVVWVLVGWLVIMKKVQNH